MRIGLIMLAVFIYGGLTFYLGWNFKRWLVAIHLSPPNIIYWSLLYIVALSFIIARLHPALHFLSVVGNYWMFLFEYGLLICLVWNLVMFIPKLNNVAWMGSIAMLLLLVLFVVGTFNAYSPTIKNVTLQVHKKGEPMRIVMASDFHLGILSGDKHLQRFVKLANEQQPDVVLLAGDLVDDDPKWFVEHGMVETMAQLKATYGTYGILGNHEYYGGKIDDLVVAMKEANVTMLLDETIELTNGVLLTGREDITNKKRASLESLSPENEDDFWIVMNHTPDDLQTPADTKVDVHVSGHTHKGQMWPNNYITNKMYELDYGYLLKGNMHAIVSSGFGFWGPPTRIGSRSELWVIDVKFTQ